MEWTQKNGVLKCARNSGSVSFRGVRLGMGYLTGKITANTKLDPKMDLRSGF